MFCVICGHGWLPKIQYWSELRESIGKGKGLPSHGSSIIKLFCESWRPSRSNSATRTGLETKVGWVLQNSGNFLSDEHKNSSFLSKNDWEKWGQRCLPPGKRTWLWITPEMFFFCSYFNEKIFWSSHSDNIIVLEYHGSH